MKRSARATTFVHDGKQFTVPRHGAKEVSTPTLNNLLKQAGIKK